MPPMNFPTVFDCTEMTDAVNKLPAMPLRFSRLFEVKGVKTTTVSLDIKRGRIVLVSDSEHNTAPESLAGRGAKREWKNLSCAHLAMSDVVAPEDIRMCGPSAAPSRCPPRPSSTTRCSSSRTTSP